MPKAGEIRYCPELGGRETHAAFVWIPPGSFWMGDKSADNNPVHFVTISKGFWFQQTTLTERQYNNQDSDMPRFDISWTSIYKFCSGKPLRMPTEAEWEYAARTNTEHKYMYSGSNLQMSGRLKSNSYGLFGMSGYARQMCIDRYYFQIGKNPQFNPQGISGENYHSYRGGNWVHSTGTAQVSQRDYVSPNNCSLSLGVRLIWEPQHV